MQLMMNLGLPSFLLTALSFLLMIKLNRQLGHMIEGRLYQEYHENWTSGLNIKYKPSFIEILLYVATFVSLGLTVGILVSYNQEITFALFGFMVTVILFWILTKEIRSNFTREEVRNRAIFEKKLHS